MKKVEVKMLRDNEWQIEKKLVLKEEKVYIPKGKEFYDPKLGLDCNLGKYFGKK